MCQFYPRDSKQRDMVCRAAIKAGFSAGLMVDDPGTKKEKTYLVLSVGGVVDVASGREEGGDITALVKGMDGVEVVETRKGKIQESGAGSVSGNGLAGRNKELKKGSKAWIVRKKEQMERKGKIVKATSKYTGRKRRPHF